MLTCSIEPPTSTLLRRQIEEHYLKEMRRHDADHAASASTRHWANDLAECLSQLQSGFDGCTLVCTCAVDAHLIWAQFCPHRLLTNLLTNTNTDLLLAFVICKYFLSKNLFQSKIALLTYFYFVHLVYMYT
jgi:hypothetical protein